MSHKIVNEEKEELIPMHQLEPFQWDVIAEGENIIDYIRRTSTSMESINRFDNMSKSNAGKCFSSRSGVKVCPLKAGHKITIEIT